MCCAKKIYKRAIRQAKRQFKDYRAAYVAELLDNKDVDFRIKWKGLRAKCKGLVSEDMEKNFVNNITDNFRENILILVKVYY